MSRRATHSAIRASVVLTALMFAAGLSGCGKTDTSASLMADARQYQDKGDVKAALIQLKNAAVKSPEDAEVRFQLASLYNQAQDPVSAEKEIRKAASLGMDSARTAPELGKALLAQGKAQQAIDETADAKGGADLLAVRGEAWMALKQPAKAKEALEQSLAAKPGYAEALIGQARLAAQDNDLDGAMRLADQAVAANPKNATVHFFRGTLLRAQNKPELALAAFGQAIALRPDHITARIERAMLEIGTKQFDAAKADIDAALKIAPNAPLVLYAQGLLDFTQGKYPAAQEALQKVLRTAPNHMPTILLMATVESALGAFQQAEHHARAYLAQFPENEYARKLLAQIQLKNSQPMEASATLTPLLKAGTQDTLLLALAGESSMRARDFGKSTEYFEKASALAPQTATLHTSLGLSKLGQGDQVSGIAELERAIALDPKSEAAATTLVTTELALKHYDKALAAVQKLIAAHPQSVNARNLEGGVYIGKGDRAAARASFEKAAAMKPDLLAPVRNLVQMDIEEKKPDAARARLVAFVDKNPKQADAMAVLAQLALMQKRPEEATTWLEKAHAENPDAVGPVRPLAAHYMRTGQQGKAVTLIRKMQTAHPADAELLDLLGQAQLATDDGPGALETYSKLVNVAPKSPQAQVRMAAAHIKMKNLGAAAEDLKKALALDPGFLPARYAQLQLAMGKGPTDETLGMARELQKLAPKAAEPVTIEGAILAAQKKPEAALKAYERAHALAPSAQSLLRVAATMKSMGKEKEADARLQQWQKEHGADPVIAMYYGETLLAKKQYKAAAEHFEVALKSAPDNPAVLNNLALAYQEQKDPRALATAERAMKLAPDNAAVVDTFGWMLAQQGDAKRALPLLQKAVALAPAARELRYHLAFALNQTGDKKAARQELDKLLSDNKAFPQMDDAKALLKLL